MLFSCSVSYRASASEPLFRQFPNGVLRSSSRLAQKFHSCYCSVCDIGDWPLRGVEAANHTLAKGMDAIKERRAWGVSGATGYRTTGLEGGRPCVVRRVASTKERMKEHAHQHKSLCSQL